MKFKIGQKVLIKESHPYLGIHKKNTPGVVTDLGQDRTVSVDIKSTPPRNVVFMPEELRVVKKRASK